MAGSGGRNLAPGPAATLAAAEPPPRCWGGEVLAAECRRISLT